MRNAAFIAVFMGLGFVFSEATVAQSLCVDTDTRIACFRKVQAAAEKTVAEAADKASANAAEAPKAGATASTGTTNATSSLPTSSFTDFFNTLHSGAETGGGGNDDPQAVAFELNHCGFTPMPRQVVRCQVRGRLEKPELYDPLKKALNAADQATRATELEDGLAVGDKTTAGLFFSLVNDRFGRELTPGTNALLNDLQREASTFKGGAVVIAQNGIQTAGDEFLNFLQPALAPLDRSVRDPIVTAFNTPDAQSASAAAPAGAFRFNMLPEPMRKAAVEKYEALARSVITYSQVRANALAAVHYFDLASLMNNQPQPLAGLEYSASTEMGGPDELRAKISYETGLVNINSFRRYQKTVCAAAADAASSTAVCLGNYLGESGVKEALASSLRFSATLEYVKRKRYEVFVPDTTVTLSEKPVHSVIGSLTMGRYLDILDDDSQRTRIDVTASYEDVSNDPKRQDRGIASATLSRQITPDWLLAAGLVYATKPEFRAEADKDLSLRLGLNYKILRKTQ